jgi:hypothetical protein
MAKRKADPEESTVPLRRSKRLCVYGKEHEADARKYFASYKHPQIMKFIDGLMTRKEPKTREDRICVRLLQRRFYWNPIPSSVSDETSRFILDMLLYNGGLTPCLLYRYNVYTHPWAHTLKILLNTERFVKAFRISRTIRLDMCTVPIHEKAWEIACENKRNVYVNSLRYPRFENWTIQPLFFSAVRGFWSGYQQRLQVGQRIVWENVFTNHVHDDGSGVDILSYADLMKEKDAVTPKQLKTLYWKAYDRVVNYRNVLLPTAILASSSMLPPVLIPIVVQYTLPIPYWQQSTEKITQLNLAKKHYLNVIFDPQ